MKNKSGKRPGPTVNRPAAPAGASAPDNLFSRHRSLILLAAIIAFIAFVLYLPALRNGFVLWDDDMYVFDNSAIRSLNGAFFSWALTDLSAWLWHPLTWLSLAVDYAIWGDNPVGYHLTAITLHAVNTSLVVLLSMRLLTAAQPPKEDESLQTWQSRLITAGVAGLLFGIHPLSVESVAWISERKDLLYTLFYLLSIICYLRNNTVTERSWMNSYLLPLCFFVLALSCKPMAVTLPLVLLLLDWYPLARITSLRDAVRRCMEKIPFFAGSLIISWVTIIAQKSDGTLGVGLTEIVPLWQRLLVASKSLVLYLWHIVLPIDLLPIYPYPLKVELFSPGYLIPLVIVTVLTATCVMMPKQRLWMTVWLFFIVTLLPVLGIHQGGKPEMTMAMANRYTYVAGIGPFLLCGLGVALGWRKLGEYSQVPRTAGITAAVAVCLLLGFGTVRQIGIWKDSITLWSYFLEREPASFPNAYINRGLSFEEAGDMPRAIEDFSRALAVNPSYVDAYVNRGQAYRNLGDLNSAIADYNTAIKLKPASHSALLNRGVAYMKQGALEKALADYDKSIAVKPDYFGGYANRADIRLKLHRPEDALADIEAAIRLKPDYSGSYLLRGDIYQALNRPGQAIDDYQKACTAGNALACSKITIPIPGIQDLRPAGR